MDDSQTPRGLIEKFMSNSEIDTTVDSKSPPTGRSNRVVKKRTLLESDVSKKWKKTRNATNRSNLSVLSESTITPRTMIEGVVQGEGSTQQSTRRQKKRTQSSRRSASFDATSSSQRSVGKEKSLRKVATMKHFLKNQTFDSGPTPRGLIQGFLEENAECTPVLQQDDPGPLHTTQIDDLCFQKKRKQSLGESYYLPSTAPEPSTHRDVKNRSQNTRQRQPRDPSEFARKTAQRMEIINMTGNISVTEDIAEPTQKEPDFTVGYEKTEDMKRVLSSRHVSMATPGDLSIPSMDDISLTNSENVSRSKIERRSASLSTLNATQSAKKYDKDTLTTVVRMVQAGELSQRSAAKKFNIPKSTLSDYLRGRSKIESQTTRHPKLTNTHDSPSPRRSTRLTTSGVSSPVTGNTGNRKLSSQRSSRISMGLVASDSEGNTTVSKSGFTTKSNTKTGQLTDVTPLSITNGSMIDILDGSRRGSKKRNQDDRHLGSLNNSIVEESNVEEVLEDEEVNETSKEDENDEDADENDCDDDGDNLAVEIGEISEGGVETTNFESSMGTLTYLQNSGYDTMHTPRLPTPKSTPTRTEKNPYKSNSSPKQVQKATAASSQRTRQKKTSSKSKPLRLPRSLTKSIFSHFCQFKVSRDVLDEVEKIADEYWKNTTGDLLAYVKHANRSTVDETDIELLMNRQGFITKQQSMHTVIAKYLPMEYRNELIPIAKSGNIVYPKVKDH